MSEKRLYAIVLRLAAMHAGAIPANHGDQVRGALLNLIRKGDSPLAQQLHDDNASKPYSISLLDGGKRGRNGGYIFGEGDQAEWRFSLMMQPAFEALLQKYLLDSHLPHVRIGAIKFAITDVFVSQAAHTNSGHVSIGELSQLWLQRHHDLLPKRIVLDFQSPTAFSLGQDKETKKYRFRTNPEAKILFSTLRKRWVRLGGIDAGDAFDDWVDEHIEQEVINLHTEKVHVENRTLAGFVGKVAYQHYGDDTRWLAYWNLLAYLTFWTGIGYQTTRGMGQVRPSLDE